LQFTSLFACDGLQLSCIAFLLFYAIILLTDFHPTLGIKEMILIIWILSLITEEIRQVCSFCNLFGFNIFMLLFKKLSCVNFIA